MPAARTAANPQRFGRIGVAIIPVYALVAGLTQRSSAAFTTDSAEYARYLATGRFQTTELLVTLGLAASGLLSIVSLAALLLHARGRRFAIAGLITGLIGSAALLDVVGSVIIRADRVRDALLHGRWAQIAITAHATGTVGGVTVVSGAALLMLGWMLLGVAVFRAPGMNRADGALLIISAPLLYLGGMVLRILPTMGSFLLLAAGLGIAMSAGRVVEQAVVLPPTPRRSPTFARFVGEDIEDNLDDDELAADNDEVPLVGRHVNRKTVAAHVARNGGRPTSSRTVSSRTVSSGLIGDAFIGDARNGDGPNGDARNGDAPNGDARNGDAPNGDARNGDAPNGHAPNGGQASGDQLGDHRDDARPDDASGSRTGRE